MAGSSNAPAVKDEDLSAQIERLRDDLKGIATTVAKLAENRVSDVRGTAEAEVAKLVRGGQHAVEGLEDEFTQIEKQVKTSIRQKPVTSVIAAVAIGYLLARLTR
jgi:ElaB/YqjD/DUF883 family membrane-anchored ribosome-binding protein